MGRNQRNPQAQTQTKSNCTIPFGFPPQPETTRFAETHHLDEKAMH